MYNIFQDHINQNLAFLKDSKILIAISGGVDSVVLTHLCHALKLNISLAHCNFNLRRDESDTDEDFVLKLAENLELEVFIQNFDTKAYADDNKRSIQMAARELRYTWFKELAEQLQFDYILTAHHADDNLETFLINFTRGTGLEGLTGIPEVNDMFVRPLLPFSSSDIVTYAKANNIEWRNDSSNASVKYLRNKLRHEVVPVLKEINPGLLQSFKNTLSNLQDTADIIDDAVNSVLENAVETIDDHQMILNISEFKRLNNPKAYLFQIFKDYGFSEWDDVLNLLDAQSGKYVTSSTHRLIKDRNHLLLSHIDKEVSQTQTITISEGVVEMDTILGTFVFKVVNDLSEKSDHIIYVDSDRLKYPLTVRKWEEGDVFYPLGMTGKKKLSKYFKDEKLSLLDKEDVWLLCSGEDIVWVINRRADNRFRVSDTTTRILKIELR